MPKEMCFCLFLYLQLHSQLCPGGKIFLPEGNTSWFQREVVLTKLPDGSGYNRRELAHRNDQIGLGDRDKQLHDNYIKLLYKTTMDPNIWENMDNVKLEHTCDEFK